MVITIIVIFIFAGITISTLTGENGLIAKAIKAKGKTEIATLEEKIKLILIDWEIDKMLDPTVTIDDFWEKLIKEGIISGEGDVTGPEKDGDNEIYILKTEGGYEVEVIVDSDGNITIGNVEKGKELSLKINVTEESLNSISVKVKVRGTGTEIVKLSYYYKTGEGEYEELEGKQDTTDLSATFTGLEQGTTYAIKVVAKEGEKTVEAIKDVTTDIIIEGTITANEPEWDETTHKASIVLTTESEYQIQWQKGGNEGKWETGTTVTGISHNETIFMRLWNGKKGGDYSWITVKDELAPSDAKVIFVNETIAIGDKIEATVELTDEQSGIDIDKCRWKFTSSTWALGTDVDTYSEGNVGGFDVSSRCLEWTPSDRGTYYLHVLTTDLAGNSVETIFDSSPIIVNWGVGTLSASQVGEHPELLGTYVSNYSDSQSLSWKVFYADSNGIYLIASNYVHVDKLAAQKTSLGFQDNGKYNIYWSSSSDFKVTSINSSIASKFMLNKLSTFNKNNPNYKMTACLMDATKWNTFRDPQWVDADNIIGGPTLEMYVASWNKRHPTIELYTAQNATGYFIGSAPNPTTTYVNLQYSLPPGGDPLFFPNWNRWNDSNGYYLASPSAWDTDRVMVSNGLWNVSAWVYDGGDALRPVVHLRSTVKLKEVGNSFVLE